MFLLVGVVYGLYGYDDMRYKEKRYVEQVESIRELQWQLIESVITDNYNSAEMFGNNIKSNIVIKLLDAYPNKANLQSDLDNPDQSMPAYTIFSQEIKGKYLNNIRNDNNDPFIASRNGIVSDLSLSSSTTDPAVRTWEKEIAMHANKPLAVKAAEVINLKINKPTFWEFSPSSNPDHILITEMDMRELRRVFMAEGVEGLQTYEFLKPIYIQQDTDIFGIPDVNNIGVRQSNSKLIVVAGFNIYDIMTTYHSFAMSKYDVTLQILARDLAETKHRSNFIHTLLCIIILFCIILTAMINNYVVSVIQKDDSCDEMGENTHTE
jgi:hypothetical protein